jgi:hypothetical protein
MNDREKGIVERLQAHPQILECVEAMLNIVEATSGHIDKANEAELLMTEQTRRIGNVALNDWANAKCEQKTKELLSQDDHIVPNGKKNSNGPQRTENKKFMK